jgi:hypothetical protein
MYNNVMMCIAMLMFVAAERSWTRCELQRELIVRESGKVFSHLLAKGKCFVC